MNNRDGWALCNNIISIQELLFKITNSAAIWLISWIDQILLQVWPVIHWHSAPTASHFGCLLLILVWLFLCQHHVLCFPDWLYAYLLASRGSFCPLQIKVRSRDTGLSFWHQRATELEMAGRVSVRTAIVCLYTVVCNIVVEQTFNKNEAHPFVITAS